MTVIAAIAVLYALLPAPAILYDSNDGAICTLPESYFVRIIEETESGYKVEYNDIEGFVRTAAATLVDYEPVTKYETTVTFTVSNDGLGANMREKPERLAPIVRVLADGETGYCYGAIDGSTLIDSVGNQWYYVRTQSGARGYVYSAYASVTATPANIIEKVPQIDDSTPTVTTPVTEVSKPVAITLIALLSAAAVAVMAIIFFRSRDTV